MKNMLAYFGAHAPSEIPDWFQKVYSITFDTPPKMPEIPEQLHDYRDQIRSWRRDPIADLEDFGSDPATKKLLAAHEKDVTEYFKDRSAWEADCEARIYFAWRVYFAGEMAAEFPEGPDGDEP